VKPIKTRVEEQLPAGSDCGSEREGTMRKTRDYKFIALRTPGV
jgi:hypothetical protein